MQIHDDTTRLTIYNRVSEIPRMTDWLCSELNRMGVSEELQYKFDLCANEAVINIISYAFTDNIDHEIRLKLFFNDGLLHLEIADDGISFNPLNKPEHQRPSSLEDADIGGLGIDLIRHYMDQIKYNRVDQNNILSMAILIGKIN